ncbi:MBOAT family protein [Eubacteriales bacterium OttesenSCG-928-M02]|nr:MBOAT family protein [Eubacteriales bacterium OttesenSCG-928-M02]
MVFSSNIFLFFYLPTVLALYYIAPRGWRNRVLFLVNLVFYGWGEPIFLVLMLFTILVNYLTGLMLERTGRDKRARKRLLVGNVVVNLSLLGFFKYAGFIVGVLKGLLPFLPWGVPNIPLPIGISFYTFQTMSYAIDVYRRDTPVQRSFVDFGTYVALYPQLIAGPIVRYRDVADQLEHRKETVSQFAHGVKLFSIGMGKKILIANQMGQLANILLPEGSMLASWVGIIAYSFQIYFDFSGYSDMARGLGNMIGFEFMKNFDYPYISKSITEFWRRWHISLSTWFKEYVYIPLGGNRKGLPRQLLNILIVWMLTGLWHGASWNFVLWGLYYAILLMGEKLFLLRLLERLPGIIRQGYTLLLVVLGWGLFYFVDLGQLGQFFANLIWGSRMTNPVAWNAIFGYLPLLVLAGVASTPIAARLYERAKNGAIVGVGTIGFVAVVLLLCVAALASQSYNPFIYFRF